MYVMLLSLSRYGYPTDAVLLTFEPKILLLGALKNTVVLDETFRKFVTKLLTFRWVMSSNFIPLSTARMQSASFSECSVTFYQSTRYQISIPGAAQMSLLFFQTATYSLCGHRGCTACVPLARSGLVFS